MRHLSNFLIFLCLTVTGCPLFAKHPDERTPAEIYAVNPPPKNTLEFIDNFTAEEQQKLYDALLHWYQIWDAKYAEDSDFLPGPRLAFRCQVRADVFTCGGVENRGGCSFPWEGRIETAAGYVFALPVLLHEMIHYHLPHPYDPEHKNRQ